MTEGTKSYLIGCHQFLLHPIWVLLAWRLEYKSWPKWWEIICIFLHDIGICGKQYLSDDYAKKGHWYWGGHYAGRIVYRFKRQWHLGWVARRFCWGHSSESGFPKSKLWKADKRSWLVAPMWWLWLNYYIEWHGKGIGVTRPPKWRKLVYENLKKENPIGSHRLYQINRECPQCQLPIKEGEK